jgi:hypothetical protein
MSQVKTLCCPECGSDNIAFEAWVDEHNNYLEDSRNYTVCGNSDCYFVNDEITPILKSEYKKEAA